MEKTLKKPITLTYEFDGVIGVYTANTYEDLHMMVQILHEKAEHYKIISVKR